MSVTREQLYEDVWAEPMTKVAPKYGVSASFLARICDRLNVPRPPRGYWALAAVGRAPDQPMLPAPGPGDELEWAPHGQARRVPRRLPKAPAGRRRRPRPTIGGRGKHELIVGALEQFEVGKETEGYLRPTKRLLVDVLASQATISRALEFANAFFVSLEDLGYPVVFAPRDQVYLRCDLDERANGGPERWQRRWKPMRPTLVFIGTVAFGLTIFEFSEEVEMAYVKGRYVPISELHHARRQRAQPAYSWTTKRDIPSGKLCLRASSPYARATWQKQWREAKPGTLPTMIPQIIRHLESEAPAIANLVEEGERQAEIERREAEARFQEWRREEDERRRKQDIEDSRRELSAIIEEWGVATQIEGFFQDAERRAAGLEDEEARAAVFDRLERARALVGGVDALQRFRAWRAPDER
jgi:hypothetical protein